MKSYDVIVIGAGVIGSSVAFHLAELGAKNVLVLDRETIGAGTTSQSSGILRTHYSVRENVELAQRSWSVFNNFASYLEDDEASCQPWVSPVWDTALVAHTLLEAGGEKATATARQPSQPLRT